MIGDHGAGRRDIATYDGLIIRSRRCDRDGATFLHAAPKKRGEEVLGLCAGRQSDKDSGSS